MMMRGTVVSLFDESGNMVRPWAEVGYRCYCYDILNDYHVEKVGSGEINYMYADLTDDETITRIIRRGADIVFGFPPCTDLAVSGSKHFAAKVKKDPMYRKKAMDLVLTVPLIGIAIGCTWVFENPVSVISSEYRKPDFVFHPWEYGNYLPEGDKHPRWPGYIPPNDAYTKKTCLWSSKDFKFPRKRPVSEELINAGSQYSATFHKLGGKSAKTKQIRSETPRGFAIAVFQANRLDRFEY